MTSKLGDFELCSRRPTIHSYGGKESACDLCANGFVDLLERSCDDRCVRLHQSHAVTGVFPQGKFQGLDLNEDLHVGGYPNYTSLAKTAGIKSGFVGKSSGRIKERAVIYVQYISICHS